MFQPAIATTTARRSMAAQVAAFTAPRPAQAPCAAVALPRIVRSPFFGGGRATALPTAAPAAPAPRMPDRIAVPSFFMQPLAPTSPQAAKEPPPAAEAPAPADTTKAWPDPNVIRAHIFSDRSSTTLALADGREFRYRVQRAKRTGIYSHYVEVDVQNGWYEYIGALSDRTDEFVSTPNAKLPLSHVKVDTFAVWWSGMLDCEHTAGITASSPASRAAAKLDARTTAKAVEAAAKLAASLATAAAEHAAEAPPSAAATDAISECMRLLKADDPDRARQRNKVGFSGADSAHGHWLAAQETLSPADALVARALCHRYRRQLPEALLAAALA